MQQKYRRLTYKLFSAALTVLAFVFALCYALSVVQRVDLKALHISWIIIVFSGIAYLIFYGLLSFHWYLVCKMFERTTSKKQMLSFFASQPYKYLPSSIFTFSFRAKYAKQLGLGLKSSSGAQVIENFNLISGGFMAALLTYLAIVNVRYSLFMLVAIGVLAYFMPQNIYLRFRQHQKVFSKRSEIFSIMLVVTAWLVAGLSFYMVTRSLGGTTGLGESIIANTLAFCVGILAVFAPGGIGVREAIYSFFSVAGVAILFWRLITFFVDVLVGLAAMAVIAYRKH